MNNNFQEVSKQDFLSLGEMSDFVKDKIELYNLQYRKPSQEERDKILLKIHKYLSSNDVVVAGSHRKTQWEDGWGENLREFLANSDLKSLSPKYFGKHKVQRINGELIIPKNDDFELKLVSLLQYAIFERFFNNSEDIYEFGAGTGHNLLRMREINTQARLHSMEWAKSGVKLLNLVAKAIKDNNLYGMVFDNFNPDHSIKLEPNSSVYTFAALEQLGEDTDKIINYWIENKPSIIVNIEPMSEPLDDNELLQHLSIQYFEKRGYLKGYIGKLRQLEKQRKIIIHEIIRTGVGSFFIEGYSVVAWSPIR